ncbi:hypothetical protein CHGG_02414 [Chaetomium globosum CBS 148.51]|uniref:DUF6570 domain-containing protein n=1 Tax=Chaetomium globosum (strain ATCC 6205 / CBS 148.51 / DSM 1962 / NBRC 6347 / NRRL 1970) TaxID=306901 RepID=Q2HBJ0_CHAGB|nr:uncharacterized protein CHGG_02414 [Chaetomium globosum CBS 148.51]EAQ90479.1 hypothetical protein CHGG_02414 [Chaetomium globosum CBS 148.51]
MYHERGRVATDSPEMAIARDQRLAIQRRHRVKRRHGEQPSPTPPLSGLLRGEQVRNAGDEAPTINRDNRLPVQVFEEEQFEGDADDLRHALQQLPHRGSLPQRRPASPGLSRGRPRGRPRLARNPVGRPRKQRLAEENTPREFDEPAPQFMGNDQEAPLSPEDIAIKREFDEALAAVEMQRCLRCKERWFVGSNTSIVDLDIVILRPRGSENAEQMDRQFRNRFRVRRAAVETWLRFLADNHPGYRSFTWNYDNLSQLPEDGNVFDQLNIHEVEECEGLPADSGPVEAPEEDGEAVDEAAVPNVLVHDSELNQLQERVDRGAAEVNAANEQVPLHPVEPQAAHQLKMPSIRRTPLDEFNQTHALLSLACPTLFPRVVADFVEPRQRKISYQDYIQHAMNWEDGRFAKHHSFRFIALNTLMRQQQGRWDKKLE